MSSRLLLFTPKSFVVAIGLVATTIFTHGQELPTGYKLVYENTFDKESKAFNDLRLTQPSKWIYSAGKSGGAIEFTGISDYQPPFRSPHTIGLIGTMQVASFVLEADMLQTGKEYGHRDMCIVFGFQDSSHFYYAHVATAMDDNAHQIMIVNGAPRTKISTYTTAGVNWGQNVWHKIRLERNADSGSIKVFFDGVLVEESTDKTFGNGYIGFGSFDDSGKVDNIKIWSDRSVKKTTEVFQPFTSR
jgi:hypothetical protein